MPRTKIRQEGEEAASEETTPADVPADDADAVADASEDTVGEVVEPEAEADAEADATPEPAPRRRRFPWRRTAPVPPAASPAAEAAEVEKSADDETDAAEIEKPVDDETDAVATETDAVEPDAAATESAESDSAAIESDSETTEPGAAADEESAEPEPVLVPHRTAGRKLKAAALVAGVLFIAAAAFAGATVQPYLADRAVVHTKFEVAETAATAITTLWTYTPEDMDSLPDRAGKFLTGDFAVEYRRFIDAIIETNKQAKVTNNTQVLGAAVESLTPTEASAIVYTNSVATSPVTKGIPSMRYLSYRLTMELRNRQWLITKMTAVTSLDLTPKL
jgi:Mce-associated membrane protein